MTLMLSLCLCSCAAPYSGNWGVVV